MKQRKDSALGLWHQNVGRFQNLRWRLTALFALILLCTLFVIGISITTFVHRTEVTAWRGRQREATRNTVSAVMNLLDSTRNSLHFINLVGLDGIEINEQLLDKLLQQNSSFQEIVYLNSQGEIVAATTAATLLQQARTEIVATPWFSAIQSGRAYYYGDVTIAADAHPYLVVAISAPNASVVAARVNLFVLWELVADHGFGESGLAYLVDQRGKIIAHTDQQLALAQVTIPQPAEWRAPLREIWYGEYVNFQGQRVVSAVAPVPGTDWLVISELSAVEAFATSRWAYLALGGGIFAFMVLMMWIGAEWLEGLILAPIERLRDGAQHIGHGDLSYRIELVRHDEIGQVAVAFNQMAAELEELYESLEQKIRERTELANRVEERTKELQAANAELQQNAHLKDEFLAMISHELRTPLSAILTLSATLQDEVYGSLVDRQRKALQQIVKSGRHLLALINDILDISKIESGKLALEIGPVSITTLCDDCLQMLQEVALAKQIRFVKEIHLTHDVTYADGRRLMQILLNLLNNAVKFTPDYGQVGLDVWDDVDQDLLTFTVWDTGIGIADEDIAKLFRPFVQLDSKLSRQYQGAGLGLALVYRLTALHGGNVTVQSTLNVGSRFTISLPHSIKERPKAIPQPDLHQ